MNILYDHQTFSMQNYGGISRYFVELMKNMPQSYHCYNSVLFTENYYFINEDFPNKGIFFDTSNFNFKGKKSLTKTVNNQNNGWQLKKRKIDLFHPTYYDDYFLNHLNSIPYVVTVYDMIHEKFLKEENDPTLLKKKISVENANHIIAISENTKKDLVELYGINTDKITVVYLSHNINPSETEIVSNLPQRYVLFVGERGWYKNFNVFVEAMKIVRITHPEIQLVCTGRPFNEEEKLFLGKHNLLNDTHQFFVSDKQLTYLYKNAEVFVFPSEYEGFGIPILEAFACNCPVALSNTSCFPEIAGDGGTYFNPQKFEEMADAILRIIEDKGWKQDKVEKASQILKNYSWQNTINQTIAVYDRIIKK